MKTRFKALENFNYNIIDEQNDNLEKIKKLLNDLVVDFKRTLDNLEFYYEEENLNKPGEDIYFLAKGDTSIVFYIEAPKLQNYRIEFFRLQLTRLDCEKFYFELGEKFKEYKSAGAKKIDLNGLQENLEEVLSEIETQKILLSLNLQKIENSEEE